jgi:CRISPR/Cas system CSM-associated protein Csm3 (group 7 of RAMP superfamily)
MSYQLKIDIQSYWHPGTGRGQGSDVDALTHRDAHGLPILPGRTLKGLLRDAATRWEQFTQADSQPALAEQLFGADADADEKWLGLVRVSDAVLAEDIRYYLLDNKNLLTGLYRSIHATAIEHDTGTAVNHSLRGMEVVVPLTLYATLDEVPDAPYKVANWHKAIEQTLGLIQAVGAHRTRGLGRAVVTLEGEK